MNPQLIPATLSALRSEPQLGFDDWAEKHIRNEDGSAFRFRPYQVVPAADMFSRSVASVALRQFSGAGKTYLFAVGYCYAVHQLKLKIGKLFPAENLTGEFFLKKLMPILHATPAVEGIRMTKDNALYKAWENGSAITGVGANSAGRIRTLEVDLCDADEIDAITEEISDEGDKLAAFLWRSRGRPRQHHWISSYPSRKGHSKIDAIMEQSDLCKWFYDCPKCSEPTYFHTENLQWGDDASRAVVECPACSQTFGDRERVESIHATGHWRNRDGERVEPGDLPSERYGRRRGLHLNAMAHVGAHADKFRNYLHEIATAKINADCAENPKKARRVVVNTVDAESYEDELGEKADAGEMEEARLHYDPAIELPEGVTRIFAGGDVNQKFTAVQIWGFGEWDIWALHYEELGYAYDNPKLWAAIQELITRKFPHPLGVGISVARMFLDCRYRTKEILRHAIRAYRVTPVMGSPNKAAPAVEIPSSKNAKPKNYKTLGPNALKDMVYDWVTPGIETRRNVWFTDATDQGFEMFGAEYFAGLLCEDRTEEMHNGKMIPIFKHDKEGGGPRNEPLDTAAYCVAAWLDSKVSHAAARTRLERKAENAKPKPKPKLRPQSPFDTLKRKGKWL